MIQQYILVLHNQVHLHYKIDFTWQKEKNCFPNSYYYQWVLAKAVFCKHWNKVFLRLQKLLEYIHLYLDKSERQHTVLNKTKNSVILAHQRVEIASTSTVWRAMKTTQPEDPDQLTSNVPDCYFSNRPGTEELRWVGRSSGSYNCKIPHQPKGQGPVVWKLISANPGFKVNQGFNTLV